MNRTALTRPVQNLPFAGQPGAPDKRPQQTRELRMFLGLFLLFWTLVNLRLIGADADDQGWLIHLLMWSPGLAALLTQWQCTHSLRGLGWQGSALRWLGFAYALPLLLVTLLYGGLWSAGLIAYDMGPLQAELQAAFSTTLSPSLMFLMTATLGLLVFFLPALGEEIGWRGFLVPALRRRYSFLATALISGAIWALYHYPLIIAGQYGDDTPRVIGLPIFSLLMFSWMILAMSVILAWLRERSASVWPAALLHAAHNLFLQNWFDRLTVKSTAAQWLTGEFGIGMAVLYSVVALFCLKSQKSREAIPAHAFAAT